MACAASVVEGPLSAKPPQLVEDMEAGRRDCGTEEVWSARIAALERQNADLRQAVKEVLVVREQVVKLEDASTARARSQKEIEQARGFTLGAEYLMLNQAAYALCALPIGTVLSIAPLYLQNQLKVSVATIGYLLMCGELLGILFMKYAEKSKRGFIVSRPHDVHLILLAVAVCLLAMPLWPQRWWPGAAAAMMLVQAFNSASKPVVAEAIHRMAVVMDREPSNIFATANQWRRMGNACVGASTPLAYMLSPVAGFFISAPILLAFTLAMAWCKTKVDFAVENFKMYKHAMGAAFDPDAGGASSVRPGRNSAIGALQEMTTAGRAAVDPPCVDRTSFRGLVENACGISAQDGAHPEVRRDGLKFQLLLFAIVHAFPTMDAFISRLPFAFLTIAIADQSGSLVVACLVLFSYQSCRAIGQSIQAWRINNAINYALTSVSVVAYSVVVAAVFTAPNVGWWFYPLIPTGLSETLAVQQFYLMRLLTIDTDSSEGDWRMRELVKASHTGTGVGSAIAFVSSTACFTYWQEQGVGLLGLGVAVAKLVLVIAIGSSLPSKTGASATRKETCEDVSGLTPHSNQSKDGEIAL